MSSENQSRRATLRTVIVIVLAALVLSESLPDIRRVWLPLGTFGVVGTNQDGFITAVEPGSPAARAGIRAGDREDIASTSPQYRFWVISGTSPGTLVPGQRLTMAVDRGGQVREVTMLSEPEALTPTTKTLLVARELALLLFVGIGASLALLRPSIATWAFYCFCLGLHGAPAQVEGMSLGVPWNYLSGIVGSSGLLYTAGYVGVVVFAALFLHEQSAGWRANVYRFAPVAWLVFSCLGTYLWLSVWFGWRTKIEQDIFLYMQWAAVIVAMYALIATYVSAQGSDRQRIRWVVVGFGIALVANIVLGTLNAYFNPPYWLYASLLLVPVVVPLTVAYAVIKHRIIDVSFVVSRALVYGILTTMLVGIFSIIDWFFTVYLHLARLGAVAEVIAVVAFGIWFNGLHRRVDSFIDATFFRQRHKAEVQLARNAAALPIVTTTKAVAQALVAEPVRALSLASAALFRRTPSGEFVREASEGWSQSDIRRLDEDDDRLLALAQTENGPLSLYDHPWRSESVPTGPARPVLLLPIIVRREVAAIVFYGSHRHGETLDPDEVKAIAGLATGAAAAYDHLETEALRNRVESLERVIAEAQIQPA